MIRDEDMAEYPKGCRKLYINENNVHCPVCDFRKFSGTMKSNLIENGIFIIGEKVLLTWKREEN